VWESFSHDGLGDLQERRFCAIWLLDGVRVGWRVSEVREAFVTTLARAMPVAVHQRHHPILIH
jgi:hypothetical protein